MKSPHSVECTKSETFYNLTCHYNLLQVESISYSSCFGLILRFSLCFRWFVDLEFRSYYFKSLELLIHSLFSQSYSLNVLQHSLSCNVRFIVSLNDPRGLIINKKIKFTVYVCIQIIIIILRCKNYQILYLVEKTKGSVWRAYLHLQIIKLFND